MLYGASSGAVVFGSHVWQPCRFSPHLAAFTHPFHGASVKSQHTGRYARTLLLGTLAILCAAGVASAHDFWLVPDAFSLAPGARLMVRGQTSSAFPTSESAVTLDRIADARLMGATRDDVVRDLSRAGTSLVLRHRPTTRGQYVVAVSLKPRSVRESGAGFRRYLELEGAPDALARYEAEGRLSGPDSLTRRYAKYAKAIVNVGTGGAAAFGRMAGHPLEFVPDVDPLALSPGDTLRVRLLYRGAPLGGIRVHAGTAPRGGTRAQDWSFTTDSVGAFAVPIVLGGLWNVRAIHVVPADSGSGADWDTHWASMVFGTRTAAGR